MRFEFATATRIIFGPGSLGEVPPLAATFGTRAFLVTGASTTRADKLQTALKLEGVQAAVFQVNGEPTIDIVTEGIERARTDGSQFVIGLGGGSALDAGKAIAALIPNEGPPLDYLEGIGQGKTLIQPSLPYIAIPTTAGTGSEVTRNAVLASPEHHIKVSLRSPLMLPRLAIVDPELTYSMPPVVTAGSGLDALTQLIEPYVSNAATPLTDALCPEGIKNVAWALRRAYHNGDDTEAREAMALASLYGGLALSNARLGAVHALAGPMGGMFPAPHGAVCARLLPYVTAANIQALQEQAPGSSGLTRYTDVARWLTGEPGAEAPDGVRWLHRLSADLGVPALKQYGLSEAAIPELVVQAHRANSMKGNPIGLSEGVLATVLRQAL